MNSIEFPAFGSWEGKVIPADEYSITSLGLLLAIKGAGIGPIDDDLMCTNLSTRRRYRLSDGAEHQVVLCTSNAKHIELPTHMSAYHEVDGAGSFVSFDAAYDAALDKHYHFLAALEGNGQDLLARCRKAHNRLV